MVDLEKVNDKIMRAELRRLKLDPAGDRATLATRLETWVAANVAADKTADCDTCKGDSHVDWERCPFCGDGEMADAQTGVARPPPRVMLPRVVVPKGDAIVVPATAAAQSKVPTEIDLDMRVKRISALKLAAARDIHALGQEILAIHDGELWMQRRASDGAPRYTNFKRFCEAELGMSHTYAYKLAHLAQTFTSAEVETLGQGKLGIVMEVSGPARERLLSLARDGAPIGLLRAEKEVERGVLDARARKRAVKAKSKAASEALKRVRKESRRDDRVTVIERMSRVVLPLYKRQPGKDGTHRPAERATDEPWAEEESENAIRTRYVVKANERGELVLIVDRARVTS